MIYLGFSLICIALIVALVYVIDQGKKERAELIQRIQAPDRAARQHEDRETPKIKPRVIDVDDDAAFNEVIEERK